MLAQPTPPWPALPPPVCPVATHHKMLAVSALRGLPTRDHEPVHACDLTDTEAADVAAWSLPR